MSVLPMNSMLGRLRMIDVLDWYDGPRLFIAENAAGNRYIAFWADEQDGESQWLYSSVSDSRIDSLISGMLDLRRIYTEPEDGLIFFAKVSDEASSVEMVTPETIDQELFPPHDDFLVPSESFFSEDEAIREDPSDALTHEITISRRNANAIIGFEPLASVATDWSRLIQSFFDVVPVPVHASVGSLTVELQTAVGPDLLTLLNKIDILNKSPTPENILSTLDHQSSKLLEILLESLHKGKLTLTIRITSGPDRARLTLSHSGVRELRLALIELNQQRVESIEVPQADDLEKVFGLIELVVNGETNLTYHLSITPRQVNYYQQAARILDLLSDKKSVTSRGKYLISRSSTDRYRFTMLLFESSSVGFAWLRFCRVQSALDLNPDTAETFLREKCTDLSPSTSRRRSRTLRSWVMSFQSQLGE